jgi:hypothetical protein
MSRVKRRLFNLLATASLVFAIATAALTARSFSRHDYIRLGRIHSPTSHEVFYVLHSSWGRLTLIRLDYKVTGNLPSTFRIDRDGNRFLPPGWSWDVDTAVAGSQTARWYLGFDITNVVMQKPLLRSRAGYPLNGVQERAQVVAVDIPYWSLVLAASVMPAWWFVHHRRLRARLRRHHYCATCGYDLRATPERCPECGTAVPPALTAC